MHLSVLGSSTASKPIHAKYGDGRPYYRPTIAARRCRRSVHAVRCSSSSSDGDSSNADAGGCKHTSASGNGNKPYPKDERECSKCLEEKQVDENLKAICGWDVKGLPKQHTSRRGVSNQVQLSTYADCIGNNLGDLTSFLQSEELKGAFGSLHLLPLYPSTGDRGFAPVTYQDVDPELGTWDQVQTLGDDYQLCLEYMVNHISPASPQFQDYIQNGADSRFDSMFVKWRDIWPKGAPSADELAKVRTRKPAPPVIGVQLADGSTVPLWNTFNDQQIDINPFSEEGWAFTEASLRSLCEKGRAKLIRLDAFGYVTKKAGTSCFMQAPEVWDLLARIKQVVKPYGVQLLCEVHEDFKINVELARHGYWVYDFALPLLMLHALKFKTAEPLRHWLSICPRRQITTLDTHDGMGVDDVTGLAPLAAVPELERSIVCKGGSINYKHYFVPGASYEADASCDNGGEECRRSSDTLNKVADFLQHDCLQGCYKSVAHQYNETYFSALGEDPKQYLLARAIQFFTPGVPMVYYVGLLGGVDDIELMKQGSIRDINRHYFSMEEAHCCLQRPVVKALIELCRFRNSHPAFHGRVFVDDATAPHELHVRWYSGSKHMAVLWADLETHEFSITHTPYPNAAALKAPASSAADAAVDAAAPTSAAGAIAAAFGVAVGDDAAAAAGVSSQDLASVFSIDALDEEARTAMRKQMADAALQELDSSGYNEKIKWSGSAAEDEELFSEMLGSANSVDFLDARKEARRMPERGARTGQSGGQESDIGSGSSSNGGGRNRGNGSSENSQQNGNGSSSKGGRVAKQARVPVAASMAAGAEQQQGYREVLMAAAGVGYDGYNMSASETDEGSASEVEDSEAESASDSAPVSDVAVCDAVEAAGVKGENGNGNGNGNGKHGVLERLDLSFGWRQPDERCEAATGG